MKMEMERNNAPSSCTMGSKIDLPIVRLFSSEQENQLKLMFFRKLHQYIVCSLSVCLHCRSGSPPLLL